MLFVDGCLFCFEWVEDFDGNVIVFFYDIVGCLSGMVYSDGYWFEIVYFGCDC